MQIPPQPVWQALTAPCIVSSSSVAVREALSWSRGLVTRGSLVSLGDYSTVGKLMGGTWVEGLMYLFLYKMHRIALHGIPMVMLETLANSIRRRTEPHVKLH
jgi:hypothetical protein